jgi:hypothetical protein
VRHGRGTFYRCRGGGEGGAIDGSARRLPKEGEAEAANKGGVRGDGAAGWLLPMVWETGGGIVRHGGAWRTAALGRIDRGRETRARPAHQRWRRGEGHLGWLAGGLALGRGEVGRDWAKN